MSVVRTPTTAKFSEGQPVLRGVEIFAAGTHRGKTYTEADLDQIIKNFEQFSTGEDAPLRVPAVLGHEENQEFLERSDLPAAAWPSRIYRDGGTLYADFDDIPPVVGRLLKNRAYRTVSAEVYDKPPEGIDGKGKMLRRIAFLGGDIPQIKTLDQIADLTEHAEPRGKFATWRPTLFRFRRAASRPLRGSVFVFSEVSPMNRQQMMEALGQHGMDVGQLTDAVPDEVLAEMLRVCESKNNADDLDEGGDTSEEKPAENHDDEFPAPKDDAEKAKMAEKIKKWTEKYGCAGNHSDMPPVDPNKPTNLDDVPPVSQDGPMPKKVTVMHQFREMIAQAKKEILAELKPVTEKVAQLDKFAEDRIAAETRARIDSEVKALIASGQALPAEVDAGKFEYLYDLPATGAVKFSENGKQKTGSPLDKALSKLKAGPVLKKFGERVKAGAETGADGELAKVERFSESAEFQAVAKATGKTPQQYVGDFKKIAEKKPGLTAKQYGVPEHVN